MIKSDLIRINQHDFFSIRVMLYVQYKSGGIIPFRTGPILKNSIDPWPNTGRSLPISILYTPKLTFKTVNFGHIVMHKIHSCFRTQYHKKKFK